MVPEQAHYLTASDARVQCRHQLNVLCVWAIRKHAVRQLKVHRCPPPMVHSRGKTQALWQQMFATATAHCCPRKDKVSGASKKRRKKVFLKSNNTSVSSSQAELIYIVVKFTRFINLNKPSKLWQQLLLPYDFASQGNGNLSQSILQFDWMTKLKMENNRKTLIFVTP